MGQVNQKEEDLNLVWSNIEYYRKSLGHHKEEVHRGDRWGKNMQIHAIFNIARAMDIPPSYLFESEEDREERITDNILASRDCIFSSVGISNNEFDAAVNMFNKIIKFQETGRLGVV